MPYAAERFKNTTAPFKRARRMYLMVPQKLARRCLEVSVTQRRRSGTAGADTASSISRCGMQT
jgi:hypothetical protein